VYTVTCVVTATGSTTIDVYLSTSIGGTYHALLFRNPTPTELQATKNLLTTTTSRVTALETQLPATTNRVAALETQLPATTTRVAALENQLPDTTTRLTALETQLPATTTRVARLEGTVSLFWDPQTRTLFANRVAAGNYPTKYWQMQIEYDNLVFRAIPQLYGDKRVAFGPYAYHTEV
jgi:uncharacterized coiled-coil protein SlyX